MAPGLASYLGKMKKQFDSTFIESETQSHPLNCILVFKGSLLLYFRSI